MREQLFGELAAQLEEQGLLVKADFVKDAGTLKRSYGYRRVRYCGLARNAVEMWLKLLAYNLRKVVALTA